MRSSVPVLVLVFGVFAESIPVPNPDEIVHIVQFFKGPKSYQEFVSTKITQDKPGLFQNHQNIGETKTFNERVHFRPSKNRALEKPEDYQDLPRFRRSASPDPEVTVNVINNVNLGTNNGNGGFGSVNGGGGGGGITFSLSTEVKTYSYTTYYSSGR